MKNKSLFKAFSIFFVAFILISWIIPASSYGTTGFEEVGYAPFGIFSIIMAPFKVFDWNVVNKSILSDGTTVKFFSYLNVILAIFSIGVFYKVLNKTGVYQNIVNNIVDKFNKHKVGFFIGTIIFFALFSAFTGLTLVSLLLAPLFVTILLKLHYTKMEAFVATFVSTLIGRIVSIASADINGINRMLYLVDWNDNILIRILVLALTIFLFILFVLYFGKKETSKEKIDDPLFTDKKKNNSRSTSAIIVSSITLLLIVIFSFGWYPVFSMTGITDIYNRIYDSTIMGYPIGMNILEMIEPFGYWTGFTMSGVLIISSMIIAFLYSFKVDEYVECFKEGFKVMAKPVFYVVLSLVPLVLISSASETIFMTISGFIYNVASPIVTIGLSSIIHGLFIGDYFAVMSMHSSFISTLFTEGTAGALFMLQLMHGVIQLITPASMVLVFGLSYLEIPYKKWLAYIWKFLIVITVLLFAFALVLGM